MSGELQKFAALSQISFLALVFSHSLWDKLAKFDGNRDSARRSVKRSNSLSKKMQSLFFDRFGVEKFHPESGGQGQIW